MRWRPQARESRRWGGWMSTLFLTRPPCRCRSIRSRAALGPEEVERQITFPIEQGLSGLPGLEQLRSTSKFGLSQVVVLFRDGTDIYFARQVINERLAAVEISAAVVRPKMGPVATGLGEVFHYIVAGVGTDPTELRTVQDWIIRPQMRTVRGTAEVNSWGGYEKQYQIRIDPDRLIKHDLTFADVIQAVEKNNFNVGGGNISQSGGMLLVRGLGRTTGVDQNPTNCRAGEGRRADPRGRRGRRDCRPRNPPRGRDGRRSGRGGAGSRFSAHGRKQPHRHLGDEAEARSRSCPRFRPTCVCSPFTTARSSSTS